MLNFTIQSLLNHIFQIPNLNKINFFLNIQLIILLVQDNYHQNFLFHFYLFFLILKFLYKNKQLYFTKNL